MSTSTNINNNIDTNIDIIDNNNNNNNNNSLTISAALNILSSRNSNHAATTSELCTSTSAPSNLKNQVINLSSSLSSSSSSSSSSSIASPIIPNPPPCPCHSLSTCPTFLPPPPQPSPTSDYSTLPLPKLTSLLLSTNISRLKLYSTLNITFQTCLKTTPFNLSSYSTHITLITPHLNTLNTTFKSLSTYLTPHLNFLPQILHLEEKKLTLTCAQHVTFVRSNEGNGEKDRELLIEEEGRLREQLEVVEEELNGLWEEVREGLLL